MQCINKTFLTRQHDMILTIIICFDHLKIADLQVHSAVPRARCELVDLLYSVEILENVFEYICDLSCPVLLLFYQGLTRRQMWSSRVWFYSAL